MRHCSAVRQAHGPVGVTGARRSPACTIAGFAIEMNGGTGAKRRAKKINGAPAECTVDCYDSLSRLNIQIDLDRYRA